MTMLAIAAGVGAEPVEIWISSHQDKVYYDSMIDLYKEKVDKNFEATVTAYGFQEMPDKLGVAIKTGVGAPDIVQLDEIFFGIYLNGPVPFVDLTDRVKKAGLDKGLVKSRLDLFSHDKKVYGLPQSLSAMLLWYRQDIFEREGIEPDKIKTWDDFIKIGEGLAENSQAMMALDWSYFEILLRQRGSSLFSPDGKLFPDMDKAVETLEWIAELQKKGIAMLPDRGSIFDPVFFSGDIINEEVFSVIGADWYGLDMIQQFASDQEGLWRAMPLPAWKERPKVRTSAFAGQGLMIYKDSKRIDQSWKFIEFVISDREANVQRFVQGNSFPAYKPSWTDPRMKEKSEFFGGQSIGKLLLSVADDVPAVNNNGKRAQAVFMLRERFFAEVMYGEDARKSLTALKKMIESPGPPGGGPPGQ
jgi:arabinosaccharide transport system substrate-binding protein